MPDIKSRFRGCLMGGAVGDALGYVIEFDSEEDIFDAYGAQGIRHLSQAGSPALISDDTQMSLFTANGILYSLTNFGEVNIQSIFLAYCEWLNTQNSFRQWDKSRKSTMWLRQVPEMNVLRAPGLTCLRALRTSRYGGTTDEPVNDSKGCGGVMRVAPIGLFCSDTDCAGLAAEAAALTHGHPLGWLSAAVLAQIVCDAVHSPSETLKDTILAAAAKVTAKFPDNDEIEGFLEYTADLAANPEISDLAGVHRCGEGWVGDEALYIAVFCALRYEKDFAAAVRCAVNHRGDSDSTGAICGNILGAWLGIEAVAKAFDTENLELRGTIEEIADDLYTAFNTGVPEESIAWQSKYVRGER